MKKVKLWLLVLVLALSLTACGKGCKDTDEKTAAEENISENSENKDTKTQTAEEEQTPAETEEITEDSADDETEADTAANDAEEDAAAADTSSPDEAETSFLSERSIDGVPVELVEIDSAEAFAAFCNRVNAETEKDNQFVIDGRLTADIDLAEVCADGTFTPISNFNGFFNGETHTVSGLTVSGEGSAGLFGKVSADGAVRSVLLSDSRIEQTDPNGYAGGIAARCYGIIESCEVSDSVEIISEASAGGITGLGANIRYCTNYANVCGSNTGGIAGNGANDAEFYHCMNYGTIQGTACIGGIVGYGGTVMNSWNYGTVTNLAYDKKELSGDAGAGGICGDTVNEILNCINEGEVSAGYMSAGGICGSLRGTLQYCINRGNIVSEKAAGGIAGWMDTDTGIMNCVTSGSVSSSGRSNYDGTAGSLVGGIYNGKLENSAGLGQVYYTGDAEDDAFEGVIAGWYAHAEIRNVYSVCVPEGAVTLCTVTSTINFQGEYPDTIFVPESDLYEYGLESAVQLSESAFTDGTLLEKLNNTASDNADYASWDADQNGYPVPEIELEE